MNFPPGPANGHWYRLTAFGNFSRPLQEDPRELRSIVFIATDGFDNYIWTTQNKGTFLADFALVVDAQTAQDLYRRICEGETVNFPDTFDIDVLKQSLGGAHSMPRPRPC